jgi:hypothetical protein
VLPPARTRRRRHRRTGRAHAAARIEHDFGCIGEVLLVHPFHGAGELAVFDRDVEFEVAKPARDVQIGRADTRPAAVGDGGLRVQHRAVPFEYADTRFEQRPVARARQCVEQRQIARAGNQQPDVHAVEGCRAQRLHVRSEADEVGVGQPQSLPRHRRDQLVEAVKAGGVRHGGEHPQRRVARLGNLLGLRQLLRGERRADRRPHLGKRLLDAGDAGSAHLDPGVAPRRDPLRGIAEPFAAHAQTCNEADAAVHREHLAMIAREPSQGAGEARRVEGAHFAAGVEQRPPQAPADAQVAQPVIDHLDAHARTRFRRERGDELASDVVVGENVILEGHRVLRRPDRRKPHRVVLAGILEDARGVARHERRAARARQRLPGKQAQRRLRRRIGTAQIHDDRSRIKIMIDLAATR